MRNYQPLSVPAAAPISARWDRLQRLAAEEGWSLETFDQSRGLMIGSRRTGGSDEVREHLRIILRVDATEVGVRTQVLDDGEWDTREITCGKYEYSRETEIAMKLELAEPAGGSGRAAQGVGTAAHRGPTVAPGRASPRNP
jgi:hypothetical protein